MSGLAGWLDWPDLGGFESLGNEDTAEKSGNAKTATPHKSETIPWGRGGSPRCREMILITLCVNKQQFIAIRCMFLEFVIN